MAALRVTHGQCNVELQRSRGLTTGRIDARFSGYTYDLLSETAQGDPEGPAVGGAFTALINGYNHDELKFGKDKVYNNTNGGFRLWDWERQDRGGVGFPRAPNTQREMGHGMISHPRQLV